MISKRVFYNLKDFIKQQDIYFQLADSLEGEMQTVAILKYCLFLVKNYNDGIIGAKLLAYDICGLYSIDIQEDHPLYHMIGKGCDLELPDHHVDGNPIELLDELIDSIEHFAKDYGVELDDSEMGGGNIAYTGKDDFGILP